MRILIDIGHPGHVHLLKNFYFAMLGKGNEIFFTIKDNLKTAIELLNYYDIKYQTIGAKKDGLLGKAFNQIKYNLKLIKIIRENNIEIGVGTSISLAHASKLTKMKSIILDDDDDEVEPLFVRFAHPFCDVLLSPEVLKGKRKKKSTIFYKSGHELAYLHPNWFSPDETILKEIGVGNNDRYFILRFNVFKAHHDSGIKGISFDDKIKLINLLSKYGKIFITTERDIEKEFKKYELKIHPARIHDLLFYATMFIGDSQTMTSEAAVLGTPAIRCNSFVGRISYIEEEEIKYGLTFGFKPDNTNAMFEKINELLKKPNLKAEWRQKRNILLNEKIDVTSFLVNFVEQYYKTSCVEE